MNRLLAFAAVVGLAGVTTSATSADRPTPEERLSRALEGRVAGTPSNCVFERDLRGPTIIDNRTLLYRQGARRVYRNDLPDACIGLDRDAILVTRSFSGSQMCRNDLFSLVDRTSGVPIGSLCRLGQFVPYEKASR